jgi:hypothetical protein
MRELSDVTLRFAFPDDQPALWRLAALDSAEIPVDPVLIAEVDGDVRAALSLSDGRVIANPFHRTMELVALLHARAAQLTGTDEQGGWRRRVRRAGVRGGLARA